jgi:16S rRNA (guanine1516-N2)-methyltransferase
VLDATAGLGRDTFLMAAVGCVVFPLERDSIVRALLADGLRRARAEPRISVSAARISEPLLGDAISQMAGWVEQLQIDAIYLDPMFAPDALNAKSKKEMQILQRLVMEQDDAEPLLRAAVATGVNRIVVKRGRQAPAIAGREPDRVYLGRSVRYDVYDWRAVETVNSR